MGIAFPYRATAEVSDEEFKALKDAVQQLGDKVQKLEQTHEADQKTHEADQQKIQQLEQQVGETKKLPLKRSSKPEARGDEAENKSTGGADGGNTKSGYRGARQSPAATDSSRSRLEPWRRTTSPWPETRRCNSARSPASTAPLRLPILRRFSSLGRATTCCLKPAWTLALQNGAVTLANGKTGNIGAQTRPST